MKNISVTWLNKQLRLCRLVSSCWHLILYLLVASAILWIQQAKAQVVENPERSSTKYSFPLIVSLQFQFLSMPFKDGSTLFTNTGVSIGSEFLYSRSRPFHQGFRVGYYRNCNAGDGLFANTQTVYQPKLIGALSGELRALGWAYAFNPPAVYKYENGK